MKNKSVFITGADGFIGSHLCELMVQEGYDVKALAIYNSLNSHGWLDTIPKEIKNNIDIISGDVRDKEIIKYAMKGSSSVLHLASLIAIPYSYLSPSSYIETNIIGTYNVLQAARDLGISKIVHTSTSEVYGTAEYVPIDEKHKLEGQSPYAASKIGADQIAVSFNKSYEMPISIIRPFNTYGPRQSSRAIIPTIITQILNGNKKIKIGNVSPTRDFTFVSDTVNGFKLSLESELTIGEVVNLGSNFEVTIEETFNLIKGIFKSDVELVTSQKRIRPKNSEVERLLSCNLKAKKLMSWEPKFGDIDGFQKGLKETIDWFSEKDNLRFYEKDNYVI